VPIELEETTDGVVLPVQAQPRARRNSITGIHAGALKVAVTQVPEKGKANAAIAGVLIDALRLKNSQITLRSGETSAHKKFLITGLSLAELQARIAEATCE
jgi:hypothetical protein